jgi:hypothetical protein
MATPAELLAQSLDALRNANRIDGTRASYRKDNPAEYGAVLAYLDGGTRPAGTLSLMGRGLVLEEDARRALASSPPVGDATKRSVGYLRYGNGELPLSHTADYDFIVTSWAGASGAGASMAKKALHYMSQISCKTGAGGTYHFGVTSEEVRANGWVLLDSVGAEMTNFQYGGSAVPLGDPGLAGYQQRWAENVTARLQTMSLDGVFIDDTLFWTTGISNGQVPQSYTQPQWMEAVRQFCAYVGTYLNQRGLYLVANASGWFPGSTDYAGDNDLALWTALAPYVDGLCSETWLWHPAFATPTTVRVLGTGWNQNWDGWMRLPALCETQGIDFVCISSSTSSVTADYQLFSLLLENQGTMIFTVGDSPYANYDRSLVWHSTYDQLPLGLPSGAKVQNGALWERQFANARIWVNPTAGTAGIY